MKDKIEFILDANNYAGKNYMSGVDKNDVLCFSQGQQALVVCKNTDSGVDVITVYPFEWSKFATIRYLRFVWIYIKYNFYRLKLLWEKRFSK
jgi:hypothetical protein